jgi:tetratricopeptide (TPR) repeat protein
MVMIASRKNPYIIGRPVSEAELFFDRENLFRFLIDNLAQQAQVILLHGQRRIGKSSVLAQIPQQLAEAPYHFVMLSLEGKSQKPLATVLHELARDISEDLNLPIALPTEATLAEQPREFADRFLVEVQQALPVQTDSPALVLLLDEFDALGNFSPDAAATHLFPYLSEAIARHKFLHIIPVIGRRLDDLPTLLSLFRQAPTFEIGLLNRQDTDALITQPSEGVMFFEESALQAIWELTAGHPYFTQVMCFALFSQAREEEWWQITREDVARVIDRAIELGEGGLAWFWDGLPIPERVLFAAAAEVAQSRWQEDQTLEIKEGDPLALLEDSGIVLTDCLHNAQRNLLDWKYLRSLKRVDAPETVERGSYRITIELVRRWLLRRHGIKQEIWELQDIATSVKADYDRARELRQNRSFYPAIQAYETVLATNPNHISAIFELAECLLATEADYRAIEVFERAAQIDQRRAADGLLRAHLGYAKRLLDRGQLPEAAQSLQRAFKIDPTAEAALRLQARLEQQQRQIPDRRRTSWGRFITDWDWKNWLGGVPRSGEAPLDSPDED